MPLVGGADLNGTASGDPTDIRFNRPYRASPTGLIYHPYWSGQWGAAYARWSMSGYVQHMLTWNCLT
eukprot:6001788-Pleurochrysis_carterae.AAC.1